MDTFFEWQDARRSSGLWPYSRSLDAAPDPTTSIHDDRGIHYSGLNFASQDYLGLANHPAVRDAVMDALDQFGPHSAGSPVLLGNTADSLALEAELAAFLGMPEVVLFPTGWAAGFAAIRALIRDADHVVLDARAHACLQQGAKAATRNVWLTEHLDAGAVEERLKLIRSKESSNGILVVSEGLFSMDSDVPDIATLQRVCREYDATFLIDVAHDLGATGPGGVGTLGTQGMAGAVDLVMGSFSKTFASNGGFLACRSRAVKEYVKFYGGTHTFSNALSPLQTAAVRAALRVARSDEGEVLRGANVAASNALRLRCDTYGLRCLGATSPIVPVVVGNTAVTRLVTRSSAEAGLLVNLVEWPAVPVNGTRLRLQVMATHSREQCVAAADILGRLSSDASRIRAVPREPRKDKSHAR
ncbi:MAG TPA: pyridoxal phosphate-dependent aminotransferase family protein [Vicinamibacterales bacterium]|nr:pyridoxal phosphate-dependent aminotransferase family protein [Vicinamibacterales bacterium]